MGNGKEAVASTTFMATDYAFAALYFVPLILSAILGTASIITLDRILNKEAYQENPGI